MSTYLYIYTCAGGCMVYIVYRGTHPTPPTLPCPLLRTVTVCRVEHLPVDRLQFVRIAGLTGQVLSLSSPCPYPVDTLFLPRSYLATDSRYTRDIFTSFLTLSTSYPTATIQQGIRKGCATYNNPITNSQARYSSHPPKKSHFAAYFLRMFDTFFPSSKTNRKKCREYPFFS